MRKVFKYNVELVDRAFGYMMPKGAKILCVQMQYGIICIWAEVEETHSPEERLFRIVGTGHPIPAECTKYVGTVQSHGFVWHVYEVGEPA